MKSNSVGYFKSLPAFDTGKAVKQGQVIATISALGLSYDVESPATGTLVSVLASESQPVQYGQVLAYIENSTEDSEEI